MIEYEELRSEIGFHQVERKISKNLIRLTVENVITTRGNSRIDLHLRIRRVESRFPLDYLIIAQLSFSKERIRHETHFLSFLTGIASKNGCKHIDIECANAKSCIFVKKLDFYSIDGENYAVITIYLICCFF